MRRLFLSIALLVLTMAAPARAQEITDSINVTVYERPYSMEIQGPTRVDRGDVLTYMARPRDQNGDPTVAFLIWEVSDTSVADIVSVTDSTAQVTTKKAGTFTVKVTIGPLDSLMVAYVPWMGNGYASNAVVASDFASNTIELRVGESGVACAVFFSGEVAWGFQAGPCFNPTRLRWGSEDAPHGPLRPLSVYGATVPVTQPPLLPPLTMLAQRILEAPPAWELEFRSLG
jgi:hypothetical protein